MPSTPKQLIEQSSRHAVHLESLKAQDWKELRWILFDIERDLLGRIAAADFTVMTRVQMERRLKSVDSMLRKRYDKDILPELNRQISELAFYEASFETKSLGNVAIKSQFDLPTEAQILTAVKVNPLSIKGRDEGILLDAFIKKWTDNDIDNAVSTIRAGYAQGLTNMQIIGNLRDVAIPANYRTMETVTRTALQHAANQSRQEVWRANSDIVKKVRWLSTLDGRTSLLCQSLSNRTFKLDEGPRPPIHPNCRSTTVAVLDDRFAMLEEGGTQMARDPETGEVYQVPANQNYYQWLKTQSAEFQDDVLGQTRGKLMRNGGLTVQRFQELQLGRNFKPLTIDEMKKLEPLAFERANIT